MSNRADIQELACPDCPAAIALVPSISGVTGERVPVVTVRHARTCPWAGRYIGVNPVTIHGSMGILIHHLDDAPPPAPSTTDGPDNPTT
ncbi:hypothetical protein [Micromonospora chersina]